MFADRAKILSVQEKAETACKLPPRTYVLTAARTAATAEEAVI